MLERIEQLVERSESFSFETTLSGLIYLKFIRDAKAMGYGVTLFFVYLNSSKLATERVDIRINKGGHSIPKEVIERRYNKGLLNFSKYSKEASDWYIYDNSATEYVLVAKSIGNTEEIINFELFKSITGNG